MPAITHHVHEPSLGDEPVSLDLIQIGLSRVQAILEMSAAVCDLVTADAEPWTDISNGLQYVLEDAAEAVMRIKGRARKIQPDAVKPGRAK